jgi:hypothetical protein
VIGYSVSLSRENDASSNRWATLGIGTYERSICAYLVDVETLDTGEKDVNGVKFRFDPERLLYAIRWKHNAIPPDIKRRNATALAPAPPMRLGEPLWPPASLRSALLHVPSARLW